jgi:hypothetical protein
MGRKRKKKIKVKQRRKLTRAERLARQRRQETYRELFGGPTGRERVETPLTADAATETTDGESLGELTAEQADTLWEDDGPAWADIPQMAAESVAEQPDTAESASEEGWAAVPGVQAADIDGQEPTETVEGASPEMDAGWESAEAPPGFGQATEQAAIQRALKGTETTQDDVPEQVLDVIGQGGQHLDSDLRETFEQRLGGDFSDVRIHTGPAAAQAAEAIDAKAFTCGNDIVFNSGEYDPESPRGQFLLAHEFLYDRTHDAQGDCQRSYGSDVRAREGAVRLA